jgi:hypothetical protein
MTPMQTQARAMEPSLPYTNVWSRELVSVKFDGDLSSYSIGKASGQFGHHILDVVACQLSRDLAASPALQRA